MPRCLLRALIPARLRRTALLLALALPLSTLGTWSATAAPPSRTSATSVVYTAGSRSAPSAATRAKVDPLVLRTVKIGKTAAEPTLGVTSDGTALFAASTMVVDTPYTWGVAETEVMRSTDGGLTWHSVQHQIPVTEDSLPPGNADPFVWVDPTTDRVFNIDLYAGCSWLNYSDDKGDTWRVSPAACGDYVNDHQTIGAGKTPPNLTSIGYPNVVYYCFNRVANADCGRSLDGGLTWTPTAQPSFEGFDPAAGGLCGGLHGHLETDPDGRLFIPKGHCGTPWIGISEDGGDSWERVRVSDLSSAGTHLSVASDSAGNLYFVWWDAQQRLPYLAVSRDHGRTWGEPMMIAPPGVTESNFPVIAAGDPGRIAVTFPSSTDADRQGADRPWNQHVVISTNALDAKPVFQAALANDPADPIHRGNCNGRCGGLWDFLDIVIDRDGGLWAVGSDDCVASCIDGATYTLHVGEGMAIRQIGGPRLRG